TLSSSLPLTIANPLSVSVVAGAVTISGYISGSSGLNVSANTAAGSLLLAGTNTYAGTTYVGQGILYVNSPNFDAGIPGDIILGNGSGAAGSAIIRELSGENIWDGSHLSISSDGVLDLNGFSENVGSIGATSLTAQVTLGGGTLYLTSGVGSGSFTGVISGTGGVSKIGGDTFTLSGANTFTGTTALSGGVTYVNGSQPASPVTVGATGPAKLLGTGTVGPLTIQSGGAVSPGSANLGTGGTGILNVAGNLTAGTGAIFDIDLAGTNVGTNYDRIAVTGTASVANATLTVGATFSPAAGTIFTILTCTGTPTGVFNGKQNGGSFNTGSRWFIVNYLSGAVTLTACTALSAVSVTPSSATSVCPSGTGATLTVNDTGGATVTHQWRKTVGGTPSDISGETGATYTIKASDFPGAGTYGVYCLSAPSCGGNVVSSNGVTVVVGSGDTTAPAVTSPADAVVTQTICS
ncbi:MAG TPA: hypothetical protein VGR00_02555, partial [Thermoanaerobaculia bacterium]|nr:hypothetical protein [Thermoanaerobaculia bacterium]